VPEIELVIALLAMACPLYSKCIFWSAGDRAHSYTFDLWLDSDWIVNNECLIFEFLGAGAENLAQTDTKR
jgi:hypothetical protein